MTAAHDVSDGGLACTLAECALAGGVGLRAALDDLVELRGGSGETCLFGEGPGGFVVGLSPEALARLVRRASELAVDVLAIGEAGGDRLEMSAAELELEMSLDAADHAWRSLTPG